MFTYIMAHSLYLHSSMLYNSFFTTTPIWILKHEEIIVVPLVLLLSLKVILQKSKLWTKSRAILLDIIIYPLLLIYGVVIFFKVANIVVLS